MNPGERLTDLYLTGSGRISRILFGLGLAPLGLAWLGFEAFVTAPPGWVARLLVAALLYPAANVTAQRLHDLGRAGWWAGPLLVGGLAAWLWRDNPFGWALGVLLLAPLFALALMPGQPGFNRYGPPPP